MAPFKCEYVPKKAILWFLWRNRHVWGAVVGDYEKYMKVLREHIRSNFANRYELKAAHKEYLTDRNPNVKAFRAMAKLYFNYEDSYVNGQDFITRCYRIHKSMRTL